MATAQFRPGVARTVDKRKATFLLPSRLLKEVDDAVATGSAASKNAFVEEALDRAIAELRRAQLRDGLQAAMADPLFRRDLEEVERDFRLADAETAREIR